MRISNWIWLSILSGLVFLTILLGMNNLPPREVALAQIPARPSILQDTTDLDCTLIYNPNNGWLIDLCPSDSNVTERMEIILDGTTRGMAALIRIYHESQGWSGIPQVAVIYSSGYIRLKPNKDPSPPIPFGSSFILGPGYWSNSISYHHNPQLKKLWINTSGLPDLPLRLRAEGQNQDFAVSYDMSLPVPRDWQTRMHVTQTYTATASFSIDPLRLTEKQGFKQVQISSMFINLGGTCDGGKSDCHDSDSVRFIGSDLVRHQIALDDLTPPSFVFSSTTALGSTWLDSLHQDDQSWQGNTPNVRIALDELPVTHNLTPQGRIEHSSDPNSDNVNLWLHDDNIQVQNWIPNQSYHISYWLLSEDDPPDPWKKVDLRSGFTFQNFEGSYNCFPVQPAELPVSATVETIPGYRDTALELIYDLGSGDGNWAQVRCDFNPPLDLSGYDHLRFDWHGDPKAENSLQVGLVNKIDGQDYIFARGFHHATHHGWWGQMSIPFAFLTPWNQGSEFNPSQVSSLFVSVVKDPQDDSGGMGSIAIDNLNAYNVIDRDIPQNFESVRPNFIAARAAAQWLATQQQDSGLLKSWQEEPTCIAHTYDQALALIVFSSQKMWSQADRLVEALADIQNGDGSWFKSRNCETLALIDENKWEGDIAWAIYALRRYLDLGGTHPYAQSVLHKGATWLAGQTASNGCLLIDHTEGTIDAWWAFIAAGPNFASEAEGIKACLLDNYWDESMARFKGGLSWHQPYLDNQTWGGAFLKAIGESRRALRALSYAHEVLRLPSQGGQVYGFDGQAGPWSIWNEGTGQYIATGGRGASDLLQELVAQQRRDGAMPASTDDFSGGGVWTTRWHGVAPTAWLYNAICGEPFHPGVEPRCYSVFLPAIIYE